MLALGLYGVSFDLRALVRRFSNLENFLTGSTRLSIRKPTPVPFYLSTR
jgi:hypothetical protein